MDIIARQNAVLRCMKKNESHQDWNRWLFLISLGAVLHSVACLNTPKKLNAVDYVGIPVCAWALKNTFSLHKKEEKGQKLWHALQCKAARMA